MALAAGTRIGTFEILAPLGAGGMGEVYRARDTRLQRDVALKLLPEDVASDPERLARFEREARTLAALNHSNIAQVHGFEGGSSKSQPHVLVMELVAGENLAQHLARGRMSVQEALAVARQIVDALEAAHDKGIIHRDLKPANIMLTPDGQVKVLDFGLAKATPETGAAGGSALLNSPTVATGVTMTGMILGTAAYMSPEQAKGRGSDKRTDVWAFGCVLFELLTGKRAFAGEDVSDTLAAILRSEPDWNAFPPDVPAHVRTIVKRCLDKDRKTRIPDLSVVRYMLNETASPAPPDGPWSKRVIPIAAAALAVGAVVSALVTSWIARSGSPPQEQSIRFAIVPPASQQPAVSTLGFGVSVSPDSTFVVYVGGTGESQLMLRRLDRLEAEPLAGPKNPRAPVISPDGKWVAFVADNQLQKIPLSGGSAIELCELSGPPFGLTWAPDNSIIFAAGNSAGGLLRVAATGGEPETFTTPDSGPVKGTHVFPSMLPDGAGLLYTLNLGSTLDDENIIVAVDLATGQHKTLIHGGSQATYVQSGHLVYLSGNSLWAIAFDLSQREVRGDPIPVVDAVAQVGTRRALYDVSHRGTLAYIPGGGRFDANRSLVWIDRDGHEQPIPAPPREYLYPRLSPDGSRIAVNSLDQETDIWIWELARQRLTRLTFDPAPDTFPVWSPDGRRILFWSMRAGPATGNPAMRGIWWQAADGTGTPERLTSSERPQWPLALSPSGDLLLFREDTPTGNHLQILRMDGKSQGEALLQLTFGENNADISPDGRWLAYQRRQSGRNQIEVTPFPNAEGGRWLVADGQKPRWSPKGDELFYLDDGLLMRVAVQTSPSFSAGAPTKVLSTRYFNTAQGRTWDVAADGQRFVMLKDAARSEPSTTPNSMVVVVNWAEELKARVPARK